MFRPNLTVKLHRRGSQRDIWGNDSWAPATNVEIGVVNVDAFSQASSVRADSSGSRGSAIELVADAKILLARKYTANIGDVIEIDGMLIEIANVQVRRNTRGVIDHFELRGKIKAEL